MVSALSEWLREAIKHLEITVTERQEGYKEALIDVQAFIAQELEIMDYEFNKNV